MADDIKDLAKRLRAVERKLDVIIEAQGLQEPVAEREREYAEKQKRLGDEAREKLSRARPSR